jgi:hypothetical protein
MSRDRAELILFINVPDEKVVKNRLHLDLRPVDRTREARWRGWSSLAPSRSRTSGGTMKAGG